MYNVKLMGLFSWKRRAKRMDNEAIAERFTRLTNLMEIRGDDPFRIRSYRNAAEMIESWPTPLKEIAAEQGVKGLQALPGVGRAISGKIMELLDKGTFDAWEKLTAETPETTLDLLRVSGIGQKTAATLHQQFKISSLADLKEFVAGGGLEMVDGIGERGAERIKDSLRRM
jgi:DNA polymerase (family 10)